MKRARSIPVRNIPPWIHCEVAKNKTAFHPSLMIQVSLRDELPVQALALWILDSSQDPGFQAKARSLFKQIKQPLKQVAKDERLRTVVKNIRKKARIHKIWVILSKNSKWLHWKRGAILWWAAGAPEKAQDFLNAFYKLPLETIDRIKNTYFTFHAAASGAMLEYSFPSVYTSFNMPVGLHPRHHRLCKVPPNGPHWVAQCLLAKLNAALKSGATALVVTGVLQKRIKEPPVLDLFSRIGIQLIDNIALHPLYSIQLNQWRGLLKRLAPLSVPRLNKISDMHLTEDQKGALLHLRQYPAAVVTGAGGVGKSMVLQQWAKMLGEKRVIIIAWINTHVQELRKKLPGFLIMTIDVFNFRFRSRRHPEICAIIVEEGYNVSLTYYAEIAKTVTQSLPNLCRLSIFGDPAQLPPIAPGSTPFELLSELEQFELTKNMRVKGSAQIQQFLVTMRSCVMNRHDLLLEYKEERSMDQRIKPPPFTLNFPNDPFLQVHPWERGYKSLYFHQRITSWFKKHYPGRVTLDDMLDVLIVGMTHRDIVEPFNTMASIYMPSLFHDDPITCKNGTLISKYPKLFAGALIRFKGNCASQNVYNGTVVLIKEILYGRPLRRLNVLDPNIRYDSRMPVTLVVKERGKKEYKVRIGNQDNLVHMKDIRVGHATTTYQAQGSQWKHVIFIGNPKSQYGDPSHLYVAFSRAQESCTIWANPDYLQRVMNKDIECKMTQQPLCPLKINWPSSADTAL